MNIRWIVQLLVLALAPVVMAQQSNQITFDEDCITAGVDEERSILFNGNFETNPEVGSVPQNWTQGLFPPRTDVQQGPLTDDEGNEIPNHFVVFENGQELIQIPQQDRTFSNRFRISMCAVVFGGQLIVTVNGIDVISYPAVPGNETGLAISEPFVANFADASGRSSVSIRYESFTGGFAAIDNVSLIPFVGGGDDEPTPTPEPIESTPTPAEQPTPANTATPAPPLAPGTPTPTPTPQIGSQSLRIIPNPPMIVVTPDDFVSRTGSRKQIELQLDILGANGKPINVLSLDPDAQIEFQIDARGETQNVGYIRGFEPGSTSNNPIDNQQRDLSEFMDNGEFTLYFVPAKAYDGVVRIIADLEYEGRGNQGQVQRRELRAVVPIVMRTDPSASLTDITGTYNPAANARIGRQPGDRGFRPDMRTNLYFRERTLQ